MERDKGFDKLKRQSQMLLYVLRTVHPIQEIANVFQGQ
jgi:hypothetical protein